MHGELIMSLGLCVSNVSRLSRDRGPEAGFGGGRIREEDEEDEEVRTASDSAMQMGRQQAHFQEPQALQGRRPMSHSRGSATSSLGHGGVEGAPRVDSALSHAGFESVNQVGQLVNRRALWQHAFHFRCDR